MSRAARGVGWLFVLWIAATPESALAMVRCSIESSTGISFGGYRTDATAPLDSVGSVSFRCDGVMAGDMVSIRFSKGRGPGSFSARQMRSGSDRLEYNLYLDAARTVVWGDGTDGTATYNATPVDGQVISIPVYGRIPPQQNVAAGTYSATVTVQMLF